MTAFTLLFVTLLIATTLTRLWLAQRHVAHIRAHRNRVPLAFASRISLEAHQKAADYTTAKSRLAMAEATAYATLLLVITLGGILQTLDEYWLALLPGTPLLRGTLLIASALAISGLMDVPFDYYRSFVLDQRFGFNRMTPRMFCTDLFKHTLLFLALGAPLIFAALWLMQVSGDGWWLFLWLGWSGFSLLMMAAYPTFIAPLFNKFTPLGDDTLRARIETLLTRCGFKSQGLFVMDGSSRSSHSNAYFTGFGASKRVVFFDTLLERLDAEEVEAVLAHELGHFKRRHVVKHMFIMFCVSFSGLALLGWLAQTEWFYAGLGVATPSDPMALLLFLLVAPVLTFLLHPLMAAYARSNEFEADRYAAQHSSAQHLINALVKLYRDNASTLTPDPLHSAFYDSHPPASLRIAHLEELAAS